MANEKKTISMDETPPKSSDVKSLEAEVAEAIKTRFVMPDLTVGKAYLLNPESHNGVAYTAGGQLSPRWVKNDGPTVAQKQAKGFVFPEEISPRLKNITVGALVLMVRPADYQKRHEVNVEALNRGWESKSKESFANKSKGPGLGEFEVKPSQKTRS